MPDPRGRRSPENDPRTRQPLDPAVIAAVCSGPWSRHATSRRLAGLRGDLRPTDDDRALAAQLIDTFPDGAEPELVTAWSARRAAATRATAPTSGASTSGPTGHLLARLTDVGALAAVLDVPPDDLEHLARWHRPDADDGPARAQHYRYLVRPTAHGGSRVIEVPKERLKEVQRRILRRLLDPLPVHPAAFGTARGRGVVAAVGRHSAADVVVCLDLARFFTTITAARVTGWCVHRGAATEPARLLARLVTNAVPRPVRAGLPPLAGADGVDRTWWRDRELATRHLPQGAPTSPALADRVCRGLDLRLTGLASRFDVTYTRYVDDLTFSGSDHVGVAALIAATGAVVQDEGFRLAADKTRVQRSSGRQRVLGAVVNDHPTLSRRERDTLKAIVHNCVVHGARSQRGDEPAERFRERLTGRVSWLAALDPVRGRRLYTDLAVVDWS